MEPVKTNRNTVSVLPKLDLSQIPGRLMADERGFLSAFSLIFVTTIVCIGSLVGMGVIRDQITQELGDIAVALDNVDQSFSMQISLGAGPIVDPPCFLAAYFDDPATLEDLPNEPPACLNLTTPPMGEAGVAPVPSGGFP